MRTFLMLKENKPPGGISSINPEEASSGFSISRSAVNTNVPGGAYTLTSNSYCVALNVDMYPFPGTTKKKKKIEILLYAYTHFMGTV